MESVMDLIRALQAWWNNAHTAPRGVDAENPDGCLPPEHAVAESHIIARVHASVLDNGPTSLERIAGATSPRHALHAA